MFNGHFSAVVDPTLEPAAGVSSKPKARNKRRLSRSNRPRVAQQPTTPIRSIEVARSPDIVPAYRYDDPQTDAEFAKIQKELSGPLGLLTVGAVPLLTREEEVELARRIKAGDEEARERMIRANLRLVVKIARDYEHLGLPLADLVSEGIIGLMKAVEKFDPSKGGKLSTYGSWWIKQQVRRALANQGRTIRLPVHVEGKLYRLGRVEAKLRGLLGREATDEEVASEMRIPRRRIARLRQAAVRTSSLDAPLGSEDDTTVSDVVRDESTVTPYQALETKTDHSMLRLLLGRLSEREARILTYRFGLDGGPEQTLEEVAGKFDLTRERIRQLQNEAFAKLRVMIDEPWDDSVAA